jgi:hypothetical protein
MAMALVKDGEDTQHGQCPRQQSRCAQSGIGHGHHQHQNPPHRQGVQKQFAERDQGYRSFQALQLETDQRTSNDEQGQDSTGLCKQIDRAGQR